MPYNAKNTIRALRKTPRTVKNTPWTTRNTPFECTKYHFITLHIIRNSSAWEFLYHRGKT